MKRVNVSDLTGAALDWAVATCRGFTPIHTGVAPNGVKYIRATHELFGQADFSPSTGWGQAGPIIEREKMTVGYDHDDEEFGAEMYVDDELEMMEFAVGPTPLIAAMRCFVASKLGNTIDIPEELL